MTVGTTGAENHGADDDDEDGFGRATHGLTAAGRSDRGDDDDEIAAAEGAVERYIGEQMARMRSRSIMSTERDDEATAAGTAPGAAAPATPGGASVAVYEDEFEAQLD
jgi:hypothetical protein